MSKFNFRLATITSLLLTASCGYRAEVSVETKGTLSDANETGTQTAEVESNSSDATAETADAVAIERASASESLAANAIIQDFKSGTISDGMTEFSIASSKISTELTMSSAIVVVNSENSFSQVTRNSLFDVFTQGHAGSAKNELYMNTPAMPVYPLAENPDDNSVSITVDGASYTDFMVSGNNINYTVTPNPGAEIVIDYTFGTTPVLTDFTISESSSSGTLSVTVNDILEDTGNYTFDQGTGLISFTTAPADDSFVKASYKENLVLLDRFSIQAGAVMNTILVTVGGAATAAYTYNLVSGDITLLQVPADGAAIVVNYDVLSTGSPIIKFPMTPPPGGFQALAAFDTATSSSIEIKYEGGEIVFEAQDFLEGRKITIEFLNPLAVAGAFTLPVTPIEGTLIIFSKSADGIKTQCGSGVINSANASDIIAGCVAGDAESIIMSYKYELEPLSEFRVENVDDPDGAIWSVWVNDVLSINYERFGSTIRFVESLPAGSQIKVRATTP